MDGTHPRMRKSGTSALLAASIAALAARPASAACINTCSMELDALVVTPPLPACATITLTPQTCICEVELTLVNTCATSFEAIDFEFYGCDSTAPCSVLPSYKDSAAVAIDGAGDPQWVLHVENAGVEYALAISAHVPAFNANPSSCAIAGLPRRTRDPAPMALGAIAMVGLVGRRRSRSMMKPSLTG